MPQFGDNIWSAMRDSDSRDPLSVVKYLLLEAEVIVYKAWTGKVYILTPL